ncbi:MAG: class I SAM-dependent methyltransferase [Moorea sp. SIO2B7]|nr:class I SAM-dependent methyltransferase [Moorena sp. SIO2B7]
MINTYYKNNEIIFEFDNVCKPINLGLKQIPLYNLLMGYWERKSNQDLIKISGLNNNCNILELGVGTGYLFYLIIKSSNNCNIFGIDYSYSMIKETKKYLQSKQVDKNILIANTFDFSKNDSIHLINENIFSIRTSNDIKFRKIYSSYLFDLLTENEILSVFNIIYRILEDEGSLYIAVLNDEIEDGSTIFEKLVNNYFKTINKIYEKCYRSDIIKTISQNMFYGYYTHSRPIKIKSIINKSNYFHIKNEYYSYIKVIGFPALQAIILELKK